MGIFDNGEPTYVHSRTITMLVVKLLLGVALVSYVGVSHVLFARKCHAVAGVVAGDVCIKRDVLVLPE